MKLFRGQVPPGAPGLVRVQDRLHDHPGRPDPRSAPPAGNAPRQARGDHRSPRIGQVTGIVPGLSSGQARTPGTRGPCLFVVTHRDRGSVHLDEYDTRPRSRRARPHGYLRHSSICCWPDAQHDVN